MAGATRSNSSLVARWERGRADEFRDYIIEFNFYDCLSGRMEQFADEILEMKVSYCCSGSQEY